MCFVWFQIGTAHYTGMACFNEYRLPRDDLDDDMRGITRRKPSVSEWASLTTDIKSPAGDLHFFSCSECSICRRKFQSFESMAHHRRTVHSLVSSQQCQHCQKCFESKETLDKHVALHSGSPGFKCLLCSETFTYSKQLGAHMKIHVLGCYFHIPFSFLYSILSFKQKNVLQLSMFSLTFIFCIFLM